jgi:hypothetical protein
MDGTDGIDHSGKKLKITIHTVGRLPRNPVNNIYLYTIYIFYIVFITLGRRSMPSMTESLKIQLNQ